MSLPKREDEIVQHLLNGQVEIVGDFLWGSNYTFLVEVTCQSKSILAVYKPTKGEQPLWDFPMASLAHREVAAYLVSREIEWNFVPITIFRNNLPLGKGSLQYYISHNPEYHYFNFSHKDKQQLRPGVLFDILINNADRKGSHIIFDENHKLWLIDHGISFHVDPKLRTVIWDFVDEIIPEKLHLDLETFLQRYGGKNDNDQLFLQSLSEHLDSDEIQAIFNRTQKLLSLEKFPAPDKDRRFFPWPQL
jgi:hypothetical protein